MNDAFSALSLDYLIRSRHAADLHGGLSSFTDDESFAHGSGTIHFEEGQSPS